ncbi:hypothetical protein [Nonomuraea sp. NPDC050202]|uniref:hypothetical protein n=1 Tax=Nonomuraea sp. NPDC050202 TaxID=3155035 RepID=UPI0034042F59
MDELLVADDLRDDLVQDPALKFQAAFPHASGLGDGRHRQQLIRQPVRARRRRQAQDRVGGVVEDHDAVRLAAAAPGNLHGSDAVAREQRVDVLLDEVGGFDPFVSGLRRDHHEITQVEPA